MKSANWKGTAELVGIGAIVASLVFVGLQMRQEQEIAIVDTYGAVAEVEINLSILAGQYMEVWQRGLEGEELSIDDQGIFIGLLAAVESHHQRMYIRWDRLGPGNPDDIASAFAYAIYILPGMRISYDAAQEFDSRKDDARGFAVSINPWEEAIDRYLARFDEEEPAVPEAKEYIFWGF